MQRKRPASPLGKRLSLTISEIINGRFARASVCPLVHLSVDPQLQPLGVENRRMYLWCIYVSMRCRMDKKSPYILQAIGYCSLCRMPHKQVLPYTVGFLRRRLRLSASHSLTDIASKVFWYMILNKIFLQLQLQKMKNIIVTAWKFYISYDSC